MRKYTEDIRHLVKTAASAIRESYLRQAGRTVPLWQCKGTIAVNMYPAPGAWGGSSFFVRQFARTMRNKGFRVVYDLKARVELIVIVDPRDDLQYKAFGMDEIMRYKSLNPEVKILHRINECDKRKNTKFMDGFLKDANSVADFTVFISEWLRDYFAGQWFAENRPHCVIYNGADPSVFYPMSMNRTPGKPFRLVTHHWSPNPMKGFAVYQMIDAMMAEGSLRDLELWVIGQWPDDIKWQLAKTFPPCSGLRLANLLRQCDAYVTASLWEPCGMHHVEGAQCGLPLLYHEDGGGIVEAGRKYGIGFRESNLVEAINTMQQDYPELRNKLMANVPSGTKMVLEYAGVVERLLNKYESIPHP